MQTPERKIDIMKPLSAMELSSDARIEILQALYRNSDALKQVVSKFTESQTTQP